MVPAAGISWRLTFPSSSGLTVVWSGSGLIRSEYPHVVVVLWHRARTAAHQLEKPPFPHQGVSYQMVPFTHMFVVRVRRCRTARDPALGLFPGTAVLVAALAHWRPRG